MIADLVQDQTQEELELALEEVDDPQKRVQLLLSLAYQIYRIDSDRAIRITEEALGTAKIAGNSTNIVQVSIAMAEILRVRGACEQAFDLLDKADKIVVSRKAYRRLKGRIELLRGMTLYSSMRLAEAVKRLKKALQIYTSLEDEKGIINTSIALGVVYSSLWLYEEAITLYADLIPILEEEKLSRKLSATYNGIGAIFSSLNNSEEALEYYRKAESFYSHSQDEFGQALTWVNMGIDYQQLEQSELALSMYLKALTVIKSTNQYPLQSRLLGNIGTAYETLGQYMKALSFEQKALTLAEQHNLHYRYPQILRCLGRLYGKMGEVEKAKEILYKGLLLAENSEDIDAQVQLHGQLEEHYKVVGETAKRVEHLDRREELLKRVEWNNARVRVPIIIARRTLESAATENQRLRLKIEKLEEEKEGISQELTARVLQLTRKDKLLARLQETLDDPSNHTDKLNLVESLKTLINGEVSFSTNDGWEHFKQQFIGLHPDFIVHLTTFGSDLTPAEIKVATLLKIGLSSKDIAAVLYISSHTVNTHRCRIRRKLGLDQSENLASFLLSL